MQEVGGSVMTQGRWASSRTRKRIRFPYQNKTKHNRQPENAMFLFGYFSAIRKLLGIGQLIRRATAPIQVDLKRKTHDVIGTTTTVIAR